MMKKLFPLIRFTGELIGLIVYAFINGTVNENIRRVARFAINRVFGKLFHFSGNGRLATGTGNTDISFWCLKKPFEETFNWQHYGAK